MENEPLLTLHGVAKSFDGTEVLHPLDLTVDAGEFLTLLGPSGCGKTTILRVIAGLESPEAGAVMLEGRDVTALPPEKRPVNTVFQSYALFPHMNVSQNIAYGLKMRGIRGAEAQTRVDEMLSLVQLEGYGKRMPTQLSGGQRQRVAIARALVLRPRLLLLDEPLGALDLQLRRQMQTELKNLQRKSGIAFIYVTHDQEEALNMSDRIVVMNAGHFCQQGAPEEIYEHPNSMFTAKFIGQTNLVRATVTARHPQEKCALDVGGLSMPGMAHGEVPALDAKVRVCLRMERVHFSPTPHSGPHLPATVTEKRYTGGTQRTVLKLHDGQEIVAIGVSHDGSDIPIGQSVAVWWDPATAALVPEEEEA